MVEPAVSASVSAVLATASVELESPVHVLEFVLAFELVPGFASGLASVLPEFELAASAEPEAIFVVALPLLSAVFQFVSAAFPKSFYVSIAALVAAAFALTSVSW